MTDTDIILMQALALILAFSASYRLVAIFNAVKRGNKISVLDVFFTFVSPLLLAVYYMILVMIELYA